METARQWLSEAEALLITAGAGMGVDSGLPDFRGNEGFWNAYPSYRDLGLEFSEMANPRNFQRDPALGWGFYGHRLNLYRATTPHEGFSMLRQWGTRLAGGTFVFTSNVDGHFEANGFTAEQVLECHGSIHHLQCLRDCEGKVWKARDLKVTIDESTMRAQEPIPLCPDCSGIARPAILMFGDMGWNASRTEAQMGNYQNWLESVADKRLGIIEIGAGTAIPSVRHQGEELCRDFPDAFLIRINPREAEVPADLDNAIGISGGGLEVLRQLLDPVA